MRSLTPLALIFFFHFYLINAEEISYLQIGSEQVRSGEYGVTKGKTETTCGCGWSNKSPARIVGGKAAHPNEFPFAVALVDHRNFIFCGGALITHSHVLTGAHCTWRKVMFKKSFSVVVGEHDVNQESETRRIIGVRSVIEHPEFDKIKLINDVAVLALTERIEFDQNIGPVCLPVKPIGKDMDHKYVRIIGWGGFNKEGTMSPFLKKVNLRIVPLQTCAMNYPKEVNAAAGKQVCTFGRNKGSCQGDSGGPVLWLDPDTNRYTLLGTVSFGKSCASTFPTVNTNVFEYMDWIKAQIAATDNHAKICTKKV